MPGEIRDLENKLTAHDREIRRLKLALDNIATPQGSRQTTVVGVTPPGGGGTGTTESILGAVTLWQNASAGTRIPGDVVVLAGDRLFSTTTTVSDLDVIGVVSDTGNVAVGANGHIRHVGYQAVVNVTGVVAAGDYLETSATDGLAQASGDTAPGPGSFALALTVAAGPGAGTVAAMLFSPLIAPEVGAGVPGHLAPVGALYWDTTNNKFYVGNAAGTWTIIGGGLGGGSERAFALGVAGAIPAGPASQFADFPFILPHPASLLRMKAAVKVAVTNDKIIRLRKATAAGGYTNWADVGAFVLTLSAGTNGGFVRIVDPANVSALEGDLFQLELEDAIGPEGNNLVVEVIYSPS